MLQVESPVRTSAVLAITEWRGAVGHRPPRRTRPPSIAAMRNVGLEESAGSPDENDVATDSFLNRCKVRFRLRHNGSVSNVADRHPALAENVNH